VCPALQQIRLPRSFQEFAEKSCYGHSDEPQATKNLHFADLHDKQVLRFAQNDHAK
jgi:hypothetical protein